MVDDRSDLGNAIALNSSMVNAARLVGPALAGVVIAAVGEGWCFFIDLGVSYMAVMVSLLLMRVGRTPRQAVRKHVLGELVEGWNYATQSLPIRSIFLLLSLVSLVGMPIVLFFAAKIARGPHTLGFLMAATGVAALPSAHAGGP